MSAEVGGVTGPPLAVPAAPSPLSPPSTAPLSPRSSAPATPASSLAGALSADTGSARGKGGRKAANPHLSDDERRRERVLKNRESAMKSLQKKKRYTESLEARAAVLSARNAELKAKIRRLLDRIPASSAAADLIASLPPLPPDLLPALPPTQLNLPLPPPPSTVYPMQSPLDPTHPYPHPHHQSQPQPQHRPSSRLQPQTYIYQETRPQHDPQPQQQHHNVPALYHRQSESSAQSYQYPHASLLPQPGHDRPLQPAPLPPVPLVPLATAPPPSNTSLESATFPMPISHSRPARTSPAVAAVSLAAKEPLEIPTGLTAERAAVGAVAKIEPISLPLGQIPDEVPRQLPSGLSNDDIGQLFQNAGPDAENLQPQQLTFDDDDAGADGRALSSTLDEALFLNLDQSQDVVDISAIMSLGTDPVDASLQSSDF